ncbi:MAG TPA: lipoate--protein ligase family protein [Bacteroidota bacterium]|nr:lipoate--protein ligase family protein [Bacteroidota bacterium]
MKWKFLNSGFRPGRFNMEFDEFLAHRLDDGADIPLLRLYGWKPYAISLGYNQQMEDFDLQKLQGEGIDIVRRPTGGRAIFHAHELTYCVVTKMNGQRPKEIYRFINEGLLAGLRLLGIEAELSNSTDDINQMYHDPESVNCFTSFARSEIQYREKKLAGSAQRRYNNVILQHGSILLGPQHKRIIEFLSPRMGESIVYLREKLDRRTIDAESILGRTVSYDEAADCIKRGFEQCHNISFNDDHVMHHHDQLMIMN